MALITQKDFRLLYPVLSRAIEKSYGPISEIKIEDDGTFNFSCRWDENVNTLQWLDSAVPIVNIDAFNQEIEQFNSILKSDSPAKTIKSEVDGLNGIRHKNAQFLIDAVKEEFRYQIKSVSVDEINNFLYIETDNRSWKVKLLLQLATDQAKQLSRLNPKYFSVLIEKDELPDYLFEKYTKREIKLIEKITSKPFRNFNLKSDMVYCPAIDRNTFNLNLNDLGTVGIVSFNDGHLYMDMVRSLELSPIWLSGFFDAIKLIGSDDNLQHLEIEGDPLTEEVRVNLNLKYLNEEDAIEIPCYFSDSPILWAGYIVESMEKLNRLHLARREEEIQDRENSIAGVKGSYLSQAVLSTFKKNEWLDRNVIIDILQGNKVDPIYQKRSSLYHGVFSLLRKSDFEEELEKLVSEGFLERKTYRIKYGKTGYQYRLLSGSTHSIPEHEDSGDGKTARMIEGFIESKTHSLKELISILDALEENPVVWSVKKDRLIPAILDTDGPVENLVSMRKRMSGRNGMTHRVMVDIEKEIKRRRG